MYKTPENFKIGRFLSKGGVLEVGELSVSDKAKLNRALKLGIVTKIEPEEPNDFKTLTMDELKAKYTVDELIEIAKGLKMRNTGKMNEEELITKIMERA